MPRKKRVYVVLHDHTASNDEWVVLSRDFANSAKAERFIRQEGKDGEAYQIACFVGGPIKVVIQQVQKRSLIREGDVGGKEVNSEKGK